MVKFTSPPPPPRANPLTIIIALLLTVSFLGAPSALTQDDEPSPLLNMRLVSAGPDCLWFSWIYHPEADEMARYYYQETGTSALLWSDINNDGFHAQTGLNPDTAYELAIFLDGVPGGEGASQEAYAVHNYRTAAAGSPTCSFPKKKKSKKLPTPVPTPRPPANTCPDLLPAIVITGYTPFSSQCQVVDGGGVGRMDLVNRGIVSAVDIWSLVPNVGVEVCFANTGAAVVFLDAAYSPRLLSSLDYTVRDGMTCTTITTTGTVVLLAS